MAMSECIMCGKPTGFFDKRNAEGYICKECADCIPSVIDCTACGTEKLKYFRDKNMQKRKLFEPTASFGTLYLDSIHKMFCISPSHKKDMPTKLCDLFFVSEIEEIALYCANPVCKGDGRSISVTCDAELYVRTHDLHIKTIISHNEKCSYKLLDGHKVEWKEDAFSYKKGRYYLYANEWFFNNKENAINKAKELILYYIKEDSYDLDIAEKEWEEEFLISKKELFEEIQELPYRDDLLEIEEIKTVD